MYRSPQSVTYTKYMLKAALLLAADAVANPNPFATLQVKFFTDPGVTLNEDRVLSDFTIADLGTAGTALDALAGPVQTENDHWALVQQVLVTAGAAPTEESLHGVLIIDTAPAGGPELAGMYKFLDATGAEAPVLIQEEDDTIQADIAVPLQPTQAV